MANLTTHYYFVYLFQIPHHIQRIINSQQNHIRYTADNFSIVRSWRQARGHWIVNWQTIKDSFADGTPYELQKPIISFTDLGYGPIGDNIQVSPRVGTPMIGLGLLEAVPSAAILALADPDDRDGDGISGRPNMVEDRTHGDTRLGRFGWKAGQPSVRQQIAGAFNGDIGITSSVFPDPNHTAPQAAAGLGELPNGGEPELSERALERVTFYSQNLAVPNRRNIDNPQVQRGWEAFQQANCIACHTPTLTTAPEPASPELAALAGQTIHPFTDLLLHDMGPGLADNRPEAQANGSEWRTAPLWGIGLTETVNGHTRFLHDGRARSLSEAILWHGGEAEAAKEAYRTMSADDRAALIAFLESL